MAEEVLTAEDFAEIHGLSNEGLQPSLKYNWLVSQITEEQWESVWQERINTKSAIKISLVQPHLKAKLDSLLKKIYPEGPSNNEVRKQFAYAFAWENCPEGLLDPEGHKINWAAYGAQVVMYQRCRPNKKVQKIKAEVESKPEVPTKEISRPTLDQSNLKHNVDLLTENIRMLESKKAEMGKEMQEIVVSLAADEKSNDKIFKTLSEKKKSMEQLKSSLQLKKALVSTAEVELEIRELEKKVMFEEYACESLESICRPGDPDLAVKKISLEAQIIEKETEITTAKAHLSNLESLKQITSSPFCINTIKRKVPGFLQSFCSACGLGFSEHYKMSLVLDCEHEYHLMCAALLKEGRCLKCECIVPEDLYAELGMSTPSGIEQVASTDPRAGLGSKIATPMDVLGLDDGVPDHDLFRSPSTSSKRRRIPRIDSDYEPDDVELVQSVMVSPRELRSASKISNDKSDIDAGIGKNDSEDECVLDTPTKKKQMLESIKKKGNDITHSKVAEVSIKKKKSEAKANKKKPGDSTRKYPLRRKKNVDSQVISHVDLTLEQQVEAAAQPEHTQGIDNSVLPEQDLSVSNLTSRSSDWQSIIVDKEVKIVSSITVEDLPVSNITTRSSDLQSTSFLELQSTSVLQLQVSPKYQKKLLILDLNGVLIKTIRKTSHIRDDLKRVSSEILRLQTTNKLVLFRPGLHKFLQEASKLMDLAIWSSMNRFNVNECVNALFPSDMHRFLFVWNQESCVEMPFKWPLGSANPVLMKPLHKVYEAFPQYGNNVILADDEVYKTYLSPPFTSIMVPTFTSAPEDDILMSYLLPILKRVAQVEDIFETLKRETRAEAYTSTSLGVLDTLCDYNLGDDHQKLVKTYCKGQIEWLVQKFGNRFSHDQLVNLQKHCTG